MKTERTPETVEWEPYMPSNGTEGASFEASWCWRCTRDAEFREKGDDCTPNADKSIGCQILAAAYRGEQPVEWRMKMVKADDGIDCPIPECTAFELAPQETHWK